MKIKTRGLVGLILTVALSVCAETDTVLVGYSSNVLRFAVADGTLWMRVGETSGAAVLTGLSTPSYLTFVIETGPEPSPVGTALSVR